MGFRRIILPVLFTCSLVGAACSSTPETVGNSEDRVETTEAPEAAGNETETPDAAANETETPVAASEGDYPFADVQGLVQICENQSFPSGMTTSTTGTRTVVFSQREASEPFEFESIALPSGSDFAISSPTSSELDYVACLTPSGEEAFSVPCDVDNTQYDLVGESYAATIYNLQTQQVEGTAMVNPSDECRTIAVIIEGTVNPTAIDQASMQAAIETLG